MRRRGLDKELTSGTIFPEEDVSNPAGLAEPVVRGGAYLSHHGEQLAPNRSTTQEAI